MKHARQKIREAVEGQLSGIQSAIIYRSRAYKVIDMPAICVQIDSESSEDEAGEMVNPRRYSRVANMRIQVIIEAIDNYDDLADDYAAQVETLIDLDRTFGGTAVDAYLYQTDTTFDGSGEKPFVKCDISYRVWYRTRANDPESNING